MSGANLTWLVFLTHQGTHCFAPAQSKRGRGDVSQVGGHTTAASGDGSYSLLRLAESESDSECWARIFVKSIIYFMIESSRF